MRRVLIFVFLIFYIGGGVAARADFADDVAKIHLEAIGGYARVSALQSLKASGVTKVGREEIDFVMWAARPDKIRTETTSKGRVLIQGYDGKNPPWLTDSSNGRVREMGAVAARAFSAEAAFDDPLLFRGKRAIAVDYAGETQIDGKTVFKLLVTENFTENAFIYLDCSTYFIIRHEAVRPGPHGPEKVETDYADFHPVDGVMLPRRIIEKSAGVVRYETVLKQVEANPAIPSGLFSRPPPPVATKP